jgi:hypothetical protein
MIVRDVTNVDDVATSDKRETLVATIRSIIVNLDEEEQAHIRENSIYSFRETEASSFYSTRGTETSIIVVTNTSFFDIDRQSKQGSIELSTTSQRSTFEIDNPVRRMVS